MSLVYLVTSLPPLRLGAPPPIERAALVERCRALLEGLDREELERALLLEEIEETCRLVAEAQGAHPGIGSGELTALVRTQRRRGPGGAAAGDLPDWVMMPLPQHVLYRRWFHVLYEQARSPFLRGYAEFMVDLKETLTALVSERQHLTKAEFVRQMEGHFDSTSQILLSHFDAKDFGIEQRFPWFPRVKAALELDDFVEMERALDRLRWEKFEELKGTEQFSVNFVLGAYFQLRILEREASWDLEAGTALLEQALRLPGGLGLEQTSA
jgi:hypothetical protein